MVRSIDGGAGLAALPEAAHLVTSFEELVEGAAIDWTAAHSDGACSGARAPAASPAHAARAGTARLVSWLHHLKLRRLHESAGTFRAAVT